MTGISMDKIVITIMATLVLLISGCMDREDYNVVIEGSLPDFAGKMIILHEVEPNAAIPADTSVIKESGAFLFRFTANEPGIYLLKVDPRNAVTLIVEPGSTIIIQGNGTPLKSHYMVEGSHGSKLIQQFEHQVHRARTSIDSLRMAHGWNRQTPINEQSNKELKKEYDQILSAYKKITTRLIEDNPSSLASLIIINRRLGNNIIFSEEEDFHYYSLTDSALMASYPVNKHVKDHHQRVERIRYQKEAVARAAERLAKGQPAPDFKMEQPSGKEISLSSLKGKIVLLYFWAAWDASSRQVNARLTEVYQNYRKKGFEVYAVSLDTYKEMWEGAIKVDKLSWINVSDLQNIYSPAVFLYQVPEKLPYFYILDKEQKIMLRSSDVEEVVTALDKQFE